MTAPAIRRILVPVDFSEGSRVALDAALFVARGLGDARVDVLHVWEPPSYIPIDTALATIGTGPPRTLEEVARLEAGRDMAALLARLEPSPERPTQSRIEAGNPVHVILAVAGEIPYDLIVMGTHGRTGVRRLVMGSIAAQVVRRSPCPVLTLRAGAPAA